MIYIDTGPFVARYLRSDQYYSQSVRSWEILEKQEQHCFTSNFVVDEAITMIARRGGYPFAAETARLIYSSRGLTILRPDEEDELGAVELFEKYADQRVSFTDCVSFVLMRRHRLSHAFAYDRHFQLAGFRLWE